jgi:hypothetical protein
MLLANQCAACRLGIIECGLSGGTGRADESGLESGEDEDEGDGESEELDDRKDKTGEQEGRGRDREREAQIEGQLERLARQARMTTYG